MKLKQSTFSSEKTVKPELDKRLIAQKVYWPAKTLSNHISAKTVAIEPNEQRVQSPLNDASFNDGNKNKIALQTKID